MGLRRFAQACTEENLWINSKGAIGCTRVSFVGMSVGLSGVNTDPAKTQALRNMPDTCDTKSALHTFLGKAQFFSPHIKDYATLAAPLFGLLKKDVPARFDDGGTNHWQKEHTQAVRILKHRLGQYPVLRFVNPDKPLYVLTDASKIAVAGALCQRDNKGLYACDYYAKILNSTQRNYDVTSLECMAIVLGLRRWENYLLGAKFTVRCFSDHRALVELTRKKNISHQRLLTWHIYLSTFDMEIHYRRGDSNLLSPADALSRLLKDPEPPDKGAAFKGDDDWVKSYNIVDMFESLFGRLQEDRDQALGDHPVAACAWDCDDNGQHLQHTDDDGNLVDDLWDDPWIAAITGAYDVGGPNEILEEERVCRLRAEHAAAGQDDDPDGAISQPAAPGELPSGALYADDITGVDNTVMDKACAEQTPADYTAGPNASEFKHPFEALDPSKQGRRDQQSQQCENQFKRDGDLLYKKDWGGRWKLCVGSAASQQAICQYYHHRYNAHQGAAAMVALIRRHFYWRGVTMMCDKVGKQCDICAREKPRTAKPYGHLNDPRHPLREHGVSYSIDHITDLGSHRKGRDYIYS